MAEISKCDIIFSMINRKRLFYKGMEVNSFGIPIFFTGKKNYIKIKNRKKNFYNITFCHTFPKNSPKNLIVMYDIPHAMKKERDWFRRHLAKFGYIMIQKSVWVGPSPLPEEFLKYLKEIKISDKLKTFKLAKSYISAMA